MASIFRVNEYKTKENKCIEASVKLETKPEYDVFKNQNLCNIIFRYKDVNLARKRLYLSA